MKKIFITGASGYIGSNIVKVLSKKNQLYCLTKTKQKKLHNVKWIIGTLTSNCDTFLKKSDY